MHHANPVGHQSVVTTMRHVMCECVLLMSRRWALLYTGHAMRVGGCNHMRNLGIARMTFTVVWVAGGWMTLVVAQGYAHDHVCAGANGLHLAVIYRAARVCIPQT